MNKLIFSFFMLCITIPLYGTADINWTLLNIPMGDTPIDSIHLNIHNMHYAMLSKNIEIYKKDSKFIYYNFFVPKKEEGGFFVIYKIRLKLPRQMTFSHGRYVYDGSTYFFFNHRQRVFLLSPFIEDTFSEDQHLYIYSVNRIDNPRWSMLHSTYITPQIRLKSKRISCFYPFQGHLLAVSNIKEKESDLYFECMNSLQVIAFRRVNHSA